MLVFIFFVLPVLIFIITALVKALYRKDELCVWDLIAIITGCSLGLIPILNIIVLAMLMMLYDEQLNWIDKLANTVQGVLQTRLKDLWG